MEEIGREAEIGHGLQDERDEGHVVGPGRYAEQSCFGPGDRVHVIRVPIFSQTTRALGPDADAGFDLPSRSPPPTRPRSFFLSVFPEWLSTVSETLDDFCLVASD